MIRFILRRLFVTIPVLFGIVFVVFALARIVPGDPCRAVLGERATDAVCTDFIRRYGLDKAIAPGVFKTGSTWELRPAEIPATLVDNQFTSYLGQLAAGRPRDLDQALAPGHGAARRAAAHHDRADPLGDGLRDRPRHPARPDLGLSPQLPDRCRHDGVRQSRGIRCPSSCSACVLAYLFAIVLKDTPLSLPPSGRLSSGVKVMPLAEVWGLEAVTGLPRGILDFLSGIYTFSALITGQWGAWLDAFRHLILPAIALGTIPLAIIARITRSSLLEVLGQDYVRTARAKGLKERSVVLRHGARNALLPVVTIIGLQLGALLSGAVLTETVFNLAGVGRTMFEAITGRDYVVIQGLHPADRGDLRAGQPHRGRLVRLPRSTDPLPMTPGLSLTPRRSAGSRHAGHDATGEPVARHAGERPAPALGRGRPGHPRLPRPRRGLRAADRDPRPQPEPAGRSRKASSSARRRASTSSAAPPISRSTCSGPMAISATSSAGSCSARGPR